MKKFAPVALAIALQAGLSYVCLFQADWLLDLTGGNSVPIAIAMFVSAAVCWLIYDWAFKDCDTEILLKICQVAVPCFAVLLIGMQVNHEPVADDVWLAGITMGFIALMTALAATAELVFRDRSSRTLT